MLFITMTMKRNTSNDTIININRNTSRHVNIHIYVFIALIHNITFYIYYRI